MLLKDNLQRLLSTLFSHSRVRSSSPNELERLSTTHEGLFTLFKHLPVKIQICFISSSFAFLFGLEIYVFEQTANTFTLQNSSLQKLNFLFKFYA